MIKMDDSDMRTVRSPRVTASPATNEVSPARAGDEAVFAPTAPPPPDVPTPTPLPEPERGGASFDVAEPRGTANDSVRQPLEFTPDGVYSLGGGWLLTLSADRLEVKRGRQQGVTGLAAASIRLGAGETAIFGVLTRAHEASGSDGSDHAVVEPVVVTSTEPGDAAARQDEATDTQTEEQDNA